MKDLKFLHNKISKIVQKIPRSGIRDFFDIVSSKKDVVSLGIGEPDFITPWRIRDKAIRSLERGRTSYTSNLGLLSLRTEISKFIKNKTDINYSPDNEVLITVGVSEGLDLAMRALIEPGDEVIYHEPCYVSYNPLIKFAHGIPIGIKTKKENGFKLTYEDLEEVVTEKTKILLLNYPNNPTGSILNKSEVEDIAKFVIKYDLIVITDEIYDEFSYDQNHFSIISVPGIRERSIYLHGFSKIWAMTGWRIGFVAAPPELTEAMMRIHQYTMLCAPIISQEAALEALKNGYQDVIDMKKEYFNRRNFIQLSLDNLDIPYIHSSGAFYIFIDIRKFGLKSNEFAIKLLESENIAVVPGTAFGESGEGFIRCSYAASMSDIKIAIKGIERFTSKLI